MARDKKKLQRYLPYVGGVALIALVGGGVYLFGKSLGGGQPPRQPEIQEISVVVPPPPPPPPPEMEKPPEPEIEEVDVPEPEPEPVDDIAESDEPPPSEDLGLDAEGVAGSDGFGLKAKKGGRGLIGGGGDREAWYAQRLEKDIEAALARDAGLRKSEFSVTIRLWIAATGAVTESELVRGTGNADLDQAIELALRTQARVREVPPVDMQPITLRIMSRS
ncbi:MAG: energy transducer TonB [Gammaproteobacteria bacterium]